MNEVSNDTHATTAGIWTCTECQAENSSRDVRCWMCNANRPTITAVEVVKPAQSTCPQCGAKFSRTEAKCPQCGWQPLSPEAAQHASRTFSLESLFLIITLVAVGLGVGLIQPGLGMLFAIVATPALVRTVAMRNRAKETGQTMDVTDKIVAFISSVVVMLVIAAAAFATFFCACLVMLPTMMQGGGRSDDLFWIWTCGSSLVVSGLLYYFFWPRRKKP